MPPRNQGQRSPVRNEPPPLPEPPDIEDGHTTTRQQPEVGELSPAIPAADWLSQASTIEVGRAVAEVEAAVIVAQKLRRDLIRAERELKRSCQHPRLADKAFYRYPRGKDARTGKPNFVEGPTVQLMREAMRCFGNCQSGVAELRRHRGWSEMTAWAWDLEQNVRQSTTFVVTHARDRSDGGAVALEAERDIYENNANMAARRERAMIERMLPTWFVEVAIDTCRTALAGDPAEFAPRVERAIKTFATWGIRQEHLEAKLGGVPRANWQAVDLATLITLYRSLQRQETTVDDEFPDLHAAGSAKATLEAAAADAAATPAPASRAEQQARIDALFAANGLGGDEHADIRWDVLGAVLQKRDEAGLLDDLRLPGPDLSDEEVSRAADALAGLEADTASKGQNLAEGLAKIGATYRRAVEAEKRAAAKAAREASGS